MGCAKPGSSKDQWICDERELGARYVFDAYNVVVDPTTVIDGKKIGHQRERHHHSTPMESVVERLVEASAIHSKFSMKFRDEREESAARVQFLEHYKTKMDEIAEKNVIGARFTQSLTLPIEVGLGAARLDKQSRHVTTLAGVRTVTFSYEWRDGHWLEVTGYPNALREHKDGILNL